MKDFVTPEGIEKRKDYYFYTGCDCIGKEHGIELWFDPEYGLSIFMDTFRYANNLWDKIRLACRMLFTGHIDTSGDMIVRDVQHVRDIALVLNHLADNWEQNLISRWEK